MATLTTSWQDLASASWSGISNAGVKLQGKYTTQSKENRTTQAQFRVITTGTTNWRTQNGKANFTGAYSNSASLVTYPNYVTAGTTILSLDKSIPHNDDGTKSISLGVEGYIKLSGSTPTFDINDVSITMPKIDTYPIISNVSDFNDEGNPIVTYSTALGFVGATVEVGIFDSTGNTQYVSYREVNVENGSYTFSLTASERNTLRNATPNSNTLSLKFKLRTTTTNNVEYFSTFDKNMSIVNANPTETHSVTELDANVITLLGGASTNYAIKYASDLQFAITPSAKKGASISSVKINDQDLTPNSGVYYITFNDVTIGTFNLVVTDTRQNTYTTTITKTLIDYVNTKIDNWSFSRASATSSNLVLSANITCFSGNFNTTPNSAIVKYSIDDTNWTTIPSSSYTFTNNKITITNLTLNNVLVYTSSGTLYLEVEDLLTTSKENKVILKGVATFEAGDNEFQVNGDLLVADTNRNNVVNVLGEIEKAKLKTYSTTEKIVGTWLNGETIYRQTFEGTFTANSSATTQSNTTLVANADKLIRAYGTYNPNGNTPIYNLGGVCSGTSQLLDAYASVTKHTTMGIILREKTYASNWYGATGSYSITVEYTKSS